jgi:hypothetical protein
MSRRQIPLLVAWALVCGLIVYLVAASSVFDSGSHPPTTAKRTFTTDTSAPVTSVPAPPRASVPAASHPTSTAAGA